MRAIILSAIFLIFGIEVFAQDPLVTTKSISEVSYNSVRVLCSTKGTGITERGICWSLAPNQLQADNYLKFGTGSFGGYSTQIVGLIPETKYYVKAYALCNKQYCYGEELEVTTERMPLPEVMTLSCSEIRKNSARIQGRVSGPEIIECGVCVSESKEDVIKSRVEKLAASGFGNYSIKVAHLQHKTTYFACFYAKNPAGISYGKTLEFTTQD
jgi:hypothetical protein